MRKALHNQRGDTIVEVLAAFVILLMVVAAFGNAIAFASRMQSRAGEIRDATFAYTAALYDGAMPQNVDSENYAFYFTSDGITVQSPSFVINGVQRQTVTVSTEFGDHTFRRFAEPVWSQGEGGDA